MTKEDIDFIKSMCFQGPDMTERQERRVRRIIDDMRMLLAKPSIHAVPEVAQTDEDKPWRKHVYPSGPWRVRWYGSETEKGYTILEDRSVIAYLGTHISSEDAQDIAWAHNVSVASTLPLPTPEVTGEGTLPPLEVAEANPSTRVHDIVQLPYTAVLKRDEDGDVVARIAELKGCVAHGQNEAEAIDNLKSMMALWIESALEECREIPLPVSEVD